MAGGSHTPDTMEPNAILIKHMPSFRSESLPQSGDQKKQKTTTMQHGEFPLSREVRKPINHARGNTFAPRKATPKKPYATKEKFTHASSHNSSCGNRA